MEALKALQTLETGEPCLAQALKRGVDLQKQIDARDMQIKSLVMDLNEMNEIAQENIILRLIRCFECTNLFLNLY